MFDWFFGCSDTKNTDINGGEGVCRGSHNANSVHTVNSIDVEHVQIESDEKMNDKRQFILNTFNQGHIIRAYKQLNEIDKAILIKDLELIQFDMVDLVRTKIFLMVFRIFTIS